MNFCSFLIICFVYFQQQKKGWWLQCHTLGRMRDSQQKRRHITMIIPFPSAGYLQRLESRMTSKRSVSVAEAKLKFISLNLAPILDSRTKFYRVLKNKKYFCLETSVSCPRGQLLMSEGKMFSHVILFQMLTCIISFLVAQMFSVCLIDVWFCRYKCCVPVYAVDIHFMLFILFYLLYFVSFIFTLFFHSWKLM